MDSDVLLGLAMMEQSFYYLPNSLTTINTFMSPGYFPFPLIDIMASPTIISYRTPPQLNNKVNPKSFIISLQWVSIPALASEIAHAFSRTREV
jgi:hypothetical protein